MPKISKKEHSIFLGDQKFHRLTFEIMYNQKHLFYVKVDEQYNDIISSEIGLDGGDVLTPIYKNGYGYIGEKPTHYIVKSDTESGVEKKTVDLYKTIIGKTLTKRPVIAILFRHSRVNYNSMRYNKEHDVIGFNFGLLYCIEQKTQGGQPDYYTSWQYKEGSTNYTRCYLSDCTVIDDTPENRAFLEDLYNKIKNLETALSNFLPKEDVLLSIISKGLLQIGSPVEQLANDSHEPEKE